MWCSGKVLSRRHYDIARSHEGSTVKQAHGFQFTNDVVYPASYLLHASFRKTNLQKLFDITILLFRSEVVPQKMNRETMQFGPYIGGRRRFAAMFFPKRFQRLDQSLQPCFQEGFFALIAPLEQLLRTRQSH
jgi:uncharacterized protein YndB with AHSA1/START domain